MSFIFYNNFLVSWVSRPLNIKLSFKKLYSSSEKIIFDSSILLQRSKSVCNHTNSFIFRYDKCLKIYITVACFLLLIWDVKFIVWERHLQSSIAIQVVCCDNDFISKINLSWFTALIFCTFPPATSYYKSQLKFLIDIQIIILCRN